MPWRETSVVDERLRFVARLLEGEGPEALADRSRQPVRYANQLPEPVEAMIVRCKKEKPHWGARKIRELCRCAGLPGTCARPS